VWLLNASGKSGHQVEADLGIGSGMAHQWRRHLEAQGTPGMRAIPGKGRFRDEELARLRRESAELREERDILPKAPAIFSRTNR
jgi:transposase